MKILDRTMAKWKNSHLSRAFITLASGQILGQAISLITTPILSRLYDVKAYGEYTIITSTATIIMAIAQLGTASAIMIPRDEIEAKKIFTIVFYIQVCISTISTLILLLIAPLYRYGPEDISYLAVLCLMLIYMLTVGTSNLLRIYMNRVGNFRALFINSLISALANLFIAVPLGIMKVGFIGFLWAMIGASACCILQMLKHSNPFVKITFSDMKHAIIQLKHFIFYQFPANGIANFAKQLPNQVFDKWFGSMALGQFSMANKIFNMPIHLIATPINNLYFRTAVQYQNEGKDLAKFSYSLVIKILSFAAIPLVLLIGFGESIFSFALGAQWAEAGTIAAIMGVQYIFSFCTACLSYCRVSIGRQKTNLFMAVVDLIVISISLLIGSIFNNITYSIYWYSGLSTLLYIVDMSVNFHCLGRYMGRYIAYSGAYIIIVGALGMAIRLLF